MRIAICLSLDFANQIKEIVNQLNQQGHEVVLPKTVEMILNGEVTFEQIIKEKKNGEISDRMIKQNILKYYFEKIKEVDAIFVLNFEKRGIKGYIGGNTFLEIGFAHVLNKRIFLLNEIPDISYKDEIKAMQPVILNGDLNLIK